MSRLLYNFHDKESSVSSCTAYHLAYDLQEYSINRIPVLLITTIDISCPPYMKYFRKNRMAYAFCTSHFEDSKRSAQILYPFGTGKPVPNQNRLSSSPMLSGSLTHTTLLLPSEMFNRIPQSLGLEEHPQGAYFTGNVVYWKCSWLYETVGWLRCTLRLINLTLRSTPSINKRGCRTN